MEIYREHTFKIKVADAGVEVRCWVEQQAEEPLDPKKVITVIKTLHEDLVKEMIQATTMNSATHYCSKLAEAILEIENMNAVEVISTIHGDYRPNIAIQNPGVVLYKNWP